MRTHSWGLLAVPDIFETPMAVHQALAHPMVRALMLTANLSSIAQRWNPGVAVCTTTAHGDSQWLHDWAAIAQLGIPELAPAIVSLQQPAPVQARTLAAWWQEHLGQTDSVRGEVALVFTPHGAWIGTHRPGQCFQHALTHMHSTIAQKGSTLDDVDAALAGLPLSKMATLLLSQPRTAHDQVALVARTQATALAIFDTLPDGLTRATLRRYKPLFTPPTADDIAAALTHPHLRR